MLSNFDRAAAFSLPNADIIEDTTKTHVRMHVLKKLKMIAITRRFSAGLRGAVRMRFGISLSIE